MVFTMRFHRFSVNGRPECFADTSNAESSCNKLVAVECPNHNKEFTQIKSSESKQEGKEKNTRDRR